MGIRSNNRERSIRAHYSLSYRCRCCCPGVILSSSFNLKDAFFDDIRSANVNLAKGENSVKSETLPRDERKGKKRRKVAEEDASFSPFFWRLCRRLYSSPVVRILLTTRKKTSLTSFPILRGMNEISSSSPVQLENQRKQTMTTVVFFGRRKRVGCERNRWRFLPIISFSQTRKRRRRVILTLRLWNARRGILS